MRDTRYKTLVYKGIRGSSSSIDDLLSVFHIDGFVPDDEFAADMDLLVSGRMSPEEHRVYLKEKYELQD